MENPLNNYKFILESNRLYTINRSLSCFLFYFIEHPSSSIKKRFLDPPPPFPPKIIQFLSTKDNSFSSPSLDIL